MRCTKCGYRIPDGKSVCPACGAAVSADKPRVKPEPAAAAKSSGVGTSAKSASPSKANSMIKYLDTFDENMLYKFGVCALNGVGMAKDTEAAFIAFQKLAARFDENSPYKNVILDGMYKLAEIYMEMKPPETSSALMWLINAAGYNHGPSVLKLKNMVTLGIIDGSILSSAEDGVNVSADGQPSAGSGGGAIGGAAIFEKNVGGVLELTYTGNSVSWAATGYIISDDGYAITNTHAVTMSDGTPVGRLHAKVCGQKVGATVVAIGDDKGGSGRGVDLALIKLDKMPQGSVPLVFADYDKVRTGDPIYVIGNSLGFGTCITSGVISDKERNLGGHMHMMYDCATNGGNSGGPVLNAEGLVIATHVAGQNSDSGKAQGMNYGIPEPDVLSFLQRCSLGVKIQKVTNKAPRGEKIIF